MKSPWRHSVAHWGTYNKNQPIRPHRMEVPMRDPFAFLLAPALLGVLLLIILLAEPSPPQSSHGNGIPLVSISQLFQ
ncbi:hypothetical protein PCA10_29360 [Metapseudomonas resinovorans NBRC 106553]|uniref:Uncharacterized protein n=1 Tax=Metapseudomonas resinovorans NBRC 106553 TaxID=1245471 RepID=S6ART8_METRE|nr:hypothetical protein PCA10_29360 [Pseudomonas resinovorans NBRC 106553]